MLTEQRYEIILNLLNEKKSITAAEVKDLLETSESTVRRDITALHKAGKLIKVFGGAVALDQDVSTQEFTVAQKIGVNQQQKQEIAKYAASLIGQEDFVYLDAGTTTGYLLDFLAPTKAVFMTNAVAHAQRLAAKGMTVILTGGELKSTTEAIVGNAAVSMLEKYHFTKGFFGTNGVDRKAGFTTPDRQEAFVKRTAMEQCRDIFVLADASKFGQISSVTFGSFSKGRIITNQIPEQYKNYDNIYAVGR